MAKPGRETVAQRALWNIAEHFAIEWMVEALRLSSGLPKPFQFELSAEAVFQSGHIRDTVGSVADLWLTCG
jgi:hypothetical protein